jgi:ribonuclease P protein component
VLAGANRLRHRKEFALAVRRGRRAGRGSLVLHLHTDPALVGEAGREQVRRVGFVVARSVGPAVVRNQVRRRLRHLMRDRLDALPLGSLLVVRAAPSAATASSAGLAADLDGALRALRTPRPARTAP